MCPCVLWIFFRPAGRGQPALVLKCEGGGAAHVWSPTRGVGDAAPRVAVRGQGARHRRWVPGFPHGSGSIGSLGTGPTKLRGLRRRRAVRRPPKIVAMAQRHAWSPTRGQGLPRYDSLPAVMKRATGVGFPVSPMVRAP